MGCESAQGWFFGRPMDADTATAWLRSQLEPEPMIS
jgi:EAL domain-containing protein (putative c-di-GMP-specific phosphodiesterase class I)